MEKRVYQVWKGNNRFLFGGRLVFGPDVKSLMVTLFLIIVPAVIFCVYVARNLMHRFGKNSGIAIIVVFVVYTILVLTFLLLTSGRDPGIIPRNLRPPEIEEEGDTRGSPTDWGAPGQRLRVFRTKDIVVNGVAVRVKYCDTCMLYRPPRCSHCSICNNCVERFDHHCPWVGQCIGQRNYRFFFYFVSSATTLCIFVFAMSAVYIKFLMDEHQSSAWAAMRRSPASVALMAFTFVAVWFVGGLTLFHLYLIGTNQTTYENFRYRYDNRINPYNLDVVNNFKEIFCTKIPSSKNKFRAKAPEDTGSPRFTGSPILAAKYGNVGIEIPGSWNNQPGEKRIYQSGETQGRTQNGENAASEVKEGYEHCASNRVIPECGDSAPHSGQRSLSTGRRSGSWEITPEAITMAANVGEGGRVNGISTPPGNR